MRSRYEAHTHHHTTKESNHVSQQRVGIGIDSFRRRSQKKHYSCTHMATEKCLDSNSLLLLWFIVEKQERL